MDDLWRTIAASLSLPVGLVLGWVHARAMGRSPVLDVRVGRVPEAIDRAEVIHRLRRAAVDPQLVAVLLRLEDAPAGYAACEDLRGAIAAIRRAGKPVYAFVESPGNALVWIASACERVFCVPTGEVGLVGLGAELTFFGAALERVGLSPDFEAAGTYKSFGEPWTRSFPSAASQEAVSLLLSDLHRGLVADIAAGRGRPPAEIEESVAHAPLSAQEAVDRGLVDELAYRDQVESWLEGRHGSKVKLVDFDAWAARDAWLEWVEQWGEGAKVVAVLHLDGTIVLEGRMAGRQTLQARKVLPILDALREDDRVAAVVLHVNSPGGHAGASDLMWREVERLRAEKPVVACYEDVSASGGVYLAAPATEVIARPSTITGSIGVFGGKLVAGEGMRRVGVHVHEISEAPNATMFSATRPFTDGQRVRFRAMLQRFYDGFVSRVAAGRHLDVAELEPHCQGRVWTGRHALERKLVDRHGDLHDAVERARVLAGLHHGGFVRRDRTSEPKTWVQRQVQHLVRQLNPAAALTRHLLSGVHPLVELALEHPAEPLAVLPFEIRPR